MSDDQPKPPEKKFVKTGSIIRESVTKMGDPDGKPKKSEKKSN